MLTFPSKNPQETPEAAAARLAESPMDSINHEISKLPITIETILTGQIIEIPKEYFFEDNESVIVTPLERHARKQPEGETHLLNHASWDCRVIGGNSEIYQPGCWDVNLDEAVLVRGRQITLS